MGDRPPARGRRGVNAWLVGVTALWGIGAALMFGVLLPAVAEGCGAPALDARSGWRVSDALHFLEGCSSEGRAAYSRQQLVDLFYLVLMARSLGGWTVVASRRLGFSSKLAAVLAGPAVLAAVGDLAENSTRSDR